MIPMRFARTFRSASAALALALAACGGSGGGDTAAMPSGSLIKPLVREPLTEADLAGIPLTELALELPWTTNTVGRSAAEGAPAASIRSAEVAGHDGFDRVTFLLGDADPLPGYDIAVVPAGSIPCGEGSYQLVAEHSLVVSFRPARAAGDGEATLAQGLRSTGASRMGRAGVACGSGDALVWVAELAQGDQIRILELRSPNRIAVDVR